MIVAREIGTDKFLGTFRNLQSAMPTFNLLRETGRLQGKIPRIVIRSYHNRQWQDGCRLRYVDGWHKE